MTRRICLNSAVFAAFALLASLAHAAPPLGPTNLGIETKPGVTLYQANGLRGSIPLKKVWVSYPSGDDGYWDLEFASSNMNTNVQFIAKFVLPGNTDFKSFQVKLYNSNVPNNVSITPTSADQWDGVTMIDKVMLNPWSLNNVLAQCKDHLTNGDGTFKNSATFTLLAGQLDSVKATGMYVYSGTSNVGSMSSLPLKPRTRVTAYLVNSEIGRGPVSDSRIAIKRPSPSGRVVSPRYVRAQPKMPFVPHVSRPETTRRDRLVAPHRTVTSKRMIIPLRVERPKRTTLYR